MTKGGALRLWRNPWSYAVEAWSERPSSRPQNRHYFTGSKRSQTQKPALPQGAPPRLFKAELRLNHAPGQITRQPPPRGCGLQAGGAFVEQLACPGHTKAFMGGAWADPYDAAY